MRSLVGIIWSSVGNASRIYPFHSLPKGMNALSVGMPENQSSLSVTLCSIAGIPILIKGIAAFDRPIAIVVLMRDSIAPSICLKICLFRELLHPIDIFFTQSFTVIMHPFVFSIRYICPFSALVNIYDMAIMVSIYEDCIFQLAKPLQDLPR